jgi:DNA-binding CsgD family transcriptional regulator
MPSTDHNDRDFSHVIDELDGSITTALERLPTPIWIAGRDGRIRWLSAGARSVLGSVTGRHFSRVIAPESLNDFRESFARKILGAADVEVQRVNLIGTSGRVAVELAAAPLEVDALVVGVIASAWVVEPERLGQQPPPRLTPRQHEVLKLLAQGYSTARIGAELNIADETARNHIRLLLSELGVHTRLEAVVVAFRNGWL